MLWSIYYDSHRGPNCPLPFCGKEDILEALGIRVKGQNSWLFQDFKDERRTDKRPALSNRKLPLWCAARLDITHLNGQGRAENNWPNIVLVQLVQIMNYIRGMCTRRDGPELGSWFFFKLSFSCDGFGNGEMDLWTESPFSFKSSLASLVECEWRAKSPWWFAAKTRPFPDWLFLMTLVC